MVSVRRRVEGEREGMTRERMGGEISKGNPPLVNNEVVIFVFKLR